MSCGSALDFPCRRPPPPLAPGRPRATMSTRTRTTRTTPPDHPDTILTTVPDLVLGPGYWTNLTLRLVKGRVHGGEGVNTEDMEQVSALIKFKLKNLTPEQRTSPSPRATSCSPWGPQHGARAAHHRRQPGRDLPRHPDGLHRDERRARELRAARGLDTPSLPPRAFTPSTEPWATRPTSTRANTRPRARACAAGSSTWQT